MRILVVEDEPQHARFLRAALTGAGTRFLIPRLKGSPRLVANGARLVVSDLGLPDMDGKAHPQNSREFASPDHCRIGARQRGGKILTARYGRHDYLESRLS